MTIAHNRLWSGDRFTLKGYTFRFTTERDEDMGPPWKEHDGHGPVSEWTTRGKLPGERILVSDGRDNPSRRYYDIQGAMKIALKDGWGPRHCAICGKEEPGQELGPHAIDHSFTAERKRQTAARAVERDFQYCADWANDRWSWAYVRVVLLDEHGAVTGESESLGGIEDNADDYLTEIGYELAEEILSRVEVDTPDVQLSEN